jgi:glycine/D-amino acid oxidase-like deaminating enzyme
MSHYDFIVIGAGVIGASVAHHLATLGAKSVLVVDRGTIGAGTTSQSSGLLRTHYSVRQNVELARSSWHAFNNFAAYVDDEASCGLVKCGYMICAPEGDKLAPLQASLDAQRGMGIEVQLLSKAEARERLPIAHFDDAALIGYEPEAGFADAYLVATGFARSARRRGVKFMENTAVTGLVRDGRRVTGVQTSAGTFSCGMLISTQNIWTPELAGWIGVPLPVKPERHTVLALECDVAPYTFKMPAFKDLGSPGMLYFRSYGGSQMLVSEGVAGETLNAPETEQGDISLDYVGEVGAQVAERFPKYEAAGLASSWTGVYDVTPDWNPVLGSVGDIEGLSVGFGFSGHGFKLSPGIGKILAQHASGQTTDVSLAPYALDRFASGALLVGKYGSGAVS